MERVRNARLDTLCEEIGDAREAMATQRETEHDAINDALGEMQRANIKAYRHAKIELARVPGGEKIRVRLLKQHGDAGEEDLAGESETGELEAETDQELADAATG